MKPEPETLYKQTATHFAFGFFIRSETEVPGAFMLELADFFLTHLLFPGCRPVSLDTKLPEMGRKLNMGEFSERRWKAAQKKILVNEYAVMSITAHTSDFPAQKIWLSVHINPPGKDEFMIS